jgi:hypothetical protein
MQLKSLLSFASSLMFFGVSNAATYNIPNGPNPGPQTIELAAKWNEFDGQKITPYPNSDSFEWSV